MGFFSKLFKGSSEDTQAPVLNKENIHADVTLYAPVTGSLLPLEEVPDIVISEKVMGDGIALLPESESIVAPCDGIVSRLLPTKNAFAIKMQNGLEVYVTFGIEAMEMGGEGFSVKVKIGDEVKKGEPILLADHRLLSSRLKSLATSMIVINSSCDIDKVIASSGKCQAGISPVLWISLAGSNS